MTFNSAIRGAEKSLSHISVMESGEGSTSGRVSDGPKGKKRLFGENTCNVMLLKHTPRRQ